MNRLRLPAVLAGVVVSCAPLAAQAHPDLSGVWRLEPGQSRMIERGGAPADEPTVTWLIDHRDPDISVVVDVRAAGESLELSLTCTTDGRECVNEVPSRGEVRRMSIVWEDEVLVVSQRVIAPREGRVVRDRIHLSPSGEELILERSVTGEADGPERQVFRKLGPHPSRRPPPERLPSVELPAELDRVLRDYERHWRAGDADALVSLFTGDGFVVRRGGWIRGQVELREALRGTSSDLRLRAVAFDHDDRVGYVVGAYGYGDEAATADTGLFVLTLRRAPDGRWLIAADLDRGGGQ